MWLLCDDQVCDWKGLPGSSARGILWHLMGRNKYGLLLNHCKIYFMNLFHLWQTKCPKFKRLNFIPDCNHGVFLFFLLLIPCSVIPVHYHLSLSCSAVLPSSSVSLCEWLNTVKLASVDRRTHTKGHRLVRDDHGRHEEWCWRCLDSLYGGLQCDVSCLHSGKECLFQLKGDGLLHEKEMWWDLW